MSKQIEILVTCDENYLNPLFVMLYSLAQNNPLESFRVWLIHESISQQGIKKYEQLGWLCQFDAQSIQISSQLFDQAKTEARYPKEMYFRLLCAEILPQDLNKVLYLDPDMLVINSIRELWDTPIKSMMMAASRHTGLLDLATPINKVRLSTDHGYFNSGMMLIDLKMAREVIKASDIKDTLEKFNQLLLLPDQDVLNHLYGKYILEVPEEKYNYDARRYLSYLTRSKGEHNLAWMMKNTVILHFCGRDKPWEESNDTRFTAIYLHYQQRLKEIQA